MTTAVIVDAVRTPGGKRNGKLRNWHAVDLASEALRALQVKRVTKAIRVIKATAA